MGVLECLLYAFIILLAFILIVYIIEAIKTIKLAKYKSNNNKRE